MQTSAGWREGGRRRTIQNRPSAAAELMRLITAERNTTSVLRVIVFQPLRDSKVRVGQKIAATDELTSLLFITEKLL